MADSIVFEESVNTEISSSEFIDKQWLYVNDNNNGSYSSQVVLDTTPLSNSGSYINWFEAFMLVPLVLQVESAAGTLTAAAAFDHMAALKSGFWNILHSLTCEFNNGNIIQQIPFLNVFCSFKNITSWSRNDLINWGDVTGFCPDTARSWCYLAAAGTNALRLAPGGSGLQNNRNSPYVSMSVLVGTGADAASLQVYNLLTQATLASSDIRTLWNEGMFCRQCAVNYDPEVAADNAFASQQGLLMGTVQAAQIYRTFVAKAANVRSIAIDAIIRLKDVADFFHKCPLLKGSTMRIYLNTNQVYFQTTLQGATYTAATAAFAANGIQSLTASPVILGGGGTNPVMMASSDLGQGLERLAPLAAVGAATTAVVNCSLSIVRTQFQQMANVIASPITSVRLYAPAYTMSPIAEQRYLSLTPTKKVVYNDLFQFYFPSQPTGNSFNILVSNGIPNIRSVLVMPLLPRASNGTASALAGATTSSSLLSPFCSTPSSPDPVSILNFQVQVSGKNLFINQLQYDYEMFYEQLVSSNQLNGSLTTSLSSGLVSKSDFQNLYRYYYGNCSRSLPSEQGVARSVQILGTPNVPAGVPLIDIMVFIEFEREMTIDIRSGSRVA